MSGLVTKSNSEVKPNAGVKSPWLSLARKIELALILFLLGTFILSVALFPAYAANNQLELTPNPNWTTDMAKAALAQLGWSPIGFVWLRYLPSALGGLIYCVVGLIIFWHAADNWFRLYTALVFIIVGTSIGAAPGVLDQVHPILGALYNFLGAIGWQLLFILFYLFPDGHFVPRWTRWLLLGWVGIYLLYGLTSSDSGLLPTLILVLLVLSAIGSQIYRYLKHSDILQRQQTKWLIYVLALFAIYIPFGIQPFVQTAAFSQNGAASFLGTMLLQYIIGLLGALIPIAIGIAILRYRLWDIDIIIRRTLIYVPLTAILAGVFAATSTIVQKIFVALTGSQSDAASALATLFVVAMFDPIKRSIQNIVDRRFKERHDPVKELKAYGDQVRAVLDVMRTDLSVNNLLKKSIAAFNAKGGAIYFEKNGDLQLAQSQGDWANDPKLIVSLGDAEKGETIGQISLGASLNGSDYSSEDRETLQTISNLVALAIRTVERSA